MDAARSGGSSFLDVISEQRWQLSTAADALRHLPASELDSALRLALDLAGEQGGADLARWRELLLVEAKRRLYPETFPAPGPQVERVAGFFFPLASAVLREQARQPGDGIIQRLPFAALSNEEIARSPSGDEYRRLLGHIESEGLLVCLAMVQAWQGFSTYEHTEEHP